METVQQSFITEEQVVTPTIEILENIKPVNNEPLTIKNIPKTVTQSFDELFPEQQHDEKNLQKAKEILGEEATQFTNAQLKDIVSEVQYLVESWLDDFEREIFEGLTLKELLHEKGGL